MGEEAREYPTLRDHDYFETEEGWIFFVLGDVHPPGRVWSCLKYVPGEGVWGNGENRYRRVLKNYTVEEFLSSIQFLEHNAPDYVFFDYTVGARVIAPPLSKIRRVYRARERLAELIGGEALHPLEERLLKLVGMLSDYSGVRLEDFGVTGSLLLGIQHNNSDIDLLVYGEQNLWRVLEALEALDGREGITLQKSRAREGWVARASARYPLPRSELEILASRVMNKGWVGEAVFSVHGVRDKPPHRYGEVLYRSLGLARRVVEVVDVRGSLFTPAVYIAEDGEAGPMRIVCYDMMLAGVLRSGDVVEVQGKLEVAEAKGGERWLQILVGSYEGVGKEYVRIVG
jgi:predicted nucleotidyltransferase